MGVKFEGVQIDFPLVWYVDKREREVGRDMAVTALGRGELGFDENRW